MTTQIKASLVEQLWGELDEAIWEWADTLEPTRKRPIDGYMMCVHPINTRIIDKACTYATALCKYLTSLGMRSYYLDDHWTTSIEGRELVCISVDDHQWRIFDYVVWVSSAPLSTRDIEVDLASTPTLIVQVSGFQVIPYCDLADMVRILERVLSPLLQCKRCYYSDRDSKYCGKGRVILTADCSEYQKVIP